MEKIATIVPQATPTWSASFRQKIFPLSALLRRSQALTCQLFGNGVCAATPLELAAFLRLHRANAMVKPSKSRYHFCQ
jgi:hypothetical protein